MKKTLMNSMASVIVIGISVVVFVLFSSMRTAPVRKTAQAAEEKVPVELAVNESYPLEIPVTGQAEALQKVQLYAEVSGILETSSPAFLEGNVFLKGDTLLKINRDEFDASLKSSMVQLYTQFAQILPEIKYSYPENYAAWLVYFEDFDLDAPLKALPEAKSDREKLYITSQGIYQSVYSILSQETRQAKYVVTAPFDGIVTESNIRTGTLVMSGQRLGTFLQPLEYEIAGSLSQEDAGKIKTGDSVVLMNDSGDSFTGEVSRISSRIQSSTQSIPVFIRVSDSRIYDGQFLSGIVQSQTSLNGVKVSNRLLNNDGKLYVLENGTVSEKSVKVLHRYDEFAVVEGLADGSRIITFTEGIYSGMNAGALNL